MKYSTALPILAQQNGTNCITATPSRFKMTCLALFISVILLFGSGCAAIEKGGGFVLQTSEKAINAVDAGVAEVDRQQAEAARQKLERAENRIDFLQDFGEDVDAALFKALEGQDRRMLDGVQQKFERADEHIDFLQQFGIESDEALFRAVEDRQRRMLKAVQHFCGRSETGKVRFELEGGGAVTLACEFASPPTTGEDG